MTTSSKMSTISCVHFRPCAVVHSELQGDDDVVLHAADLAAEGDALLAETVDGLLKLEGVHLHLLLDAASGSYWVLTAAEGHKKRFAGRGACC